MCGIAGVLHEAGRTGGSDLVARIVRSQHRRGPDHQAVEEIKSGPLQLTLGHNRLSIIDLSAAGHQPMWNVEGDLCLVHNGEVYNYVELREELEARGHRFRSSTDTEVVLEAFKEWGSGAFARFNGMFALALFDVTNHRLYLVRDRFGVKPLYYALGRRGLVFASTPTVIARDLDLPPDLEYVSRGVTYGIYDRGEAAPFQGMKALAPGHYLETWQDGGRLTMRLCPYYDLQGRVGALVDSLARLSTPRLVHEVSETIDDAVGIRLRADVPVGVALSGGLDSSTIAAVSAAHHERGVQAFTFGHPGDPGSEGAEAQKLGEAIGMKIDFTHPGKVDPVETFFATLEAQGAPFASASVMAQYLVYKSAHLAGLKVLLGGQGADEVFMGYRKFYVFRLRRLLRERRYVDALRCGVDLLRIAAVELPHPRAYWEAGQRYRQGRVRAALRLPDCAPLALGADPRLPTRLRQIGDVEQYSLPTLLRYEDRNSMGNSIESRLPFMDYRLVELGLALPEAVKVHRGYGKWIVREAMRERVPESILTNRRKRGFDVQQDGWIADGLGQAIREAIRASRAVIQDWIAPGTYLDEMFSDRALARRRGAFAEATTLIWLGDARR
jgi:asparagine synthase (glutamine-hydrolysing)